MEQRTRRIVSGAEDVRDRQWSTGRTGSSVEQRMCGIAQVLAQAKHGMRLGILGAPGCPCASRALLRGACVARVKVLR